MVYLVDFVNKYCGACAEAVQAHLVLVISFRVPECIVKVGGYNVDGMLGLNPQEI